ncbi:MAG: hypothetical protein CBC65_002070 [Rhodothermaceae bacterium TMED105]|nr:MAG: hypothetical protein CBC65_002070 [Rhodothermaceae bacterium TMED105]|tara:strand:+ start:1767 stop:2192 length:426 start_codon:yes stop_codon:yes gene_type:complete
MAEQSDLREEIEKVRREKVQEDARRYASRREREDSIRRHSDAYGFKWCTDNVNQLVKIVKSFKNGENVTDLEVRIYNRQDNSMTMVSIKDVLVALKDMTNNMDTEKLELPKPTAFGQISITPSIHVSTTIFMVLFSHFVNE